RLSTSGELAKVAAARKTDPAKLSRLMRGELDWVVMKCLEKDRSRRYDTASNLARDVERFLKDEPVEARPPSAWYRLCKAARRNRTALTVSGVVAAAVVIGTAATLWQAAKRIEEQAIADAKLKDLEDKQIAERRQEKLDRAIEAAFSSDPVKAHKAIVEAEQAGVAADRVHWLYGLVYFQQGKFEDANREFDASIALKPSIAAYATQFLALFGAGGEAGEPFRHVTRSKFDLIRSMTPETPEDYLCRGHLTAMDVSLISLALADLDKAIAL